MATAARHCNPQWWKAEYDSKWDRVKAAFRRDWEQTKHDMGAKAPDLNQDVDDTVAQAAGRRPIPAGDTPNFDEEESACRFGYGARQHYGARHTGWNPDTEAELRRDWASVGNADWERHRESIRRGWEYED